MKTEDTKAEFGLTAHFRVPKMKFNKLEIGVFQIQIDLGKAFQISTPVKIIHQ